MNFEFAEQINSFLEQADYSKAIEIAETNLSKIPKTVFHDIIGKSLLHHTDKLADWINTFYIETSENTDIKSLYFEMCEFDINTDNWFISGFAYDKDGGLNLDDMEWLCDMVDDSNEFILTGYETLQKAFEDTELDNDSIENARDWCEQIVIARYMELIHSGHLKAKEKNLKWATIPLYFTEHAYDFVVKSS